eukprot:71596-Alexandrium_andersonii.AAC.1
MFTRRSWPSCGGLCCRLGARSRTRAHVPTACSGTPVGARGMVTGRRNGRCRPSATPKPRWAVASCG